LFSQYKVTVVIPYFNSEAYIRRCLESVISQSLTDIQIICVDDGSTDNSTNIVSSIAENDERVILLSQPNGGAGKARNLAFDYIKGDYVLFLDADDFLSTEALSEAFSLAIEDNSDVVVMKSYAFEDGVEENYWTQKNCIRFDLLPRERKFKLSEIRKDIFSAFIWWPWDKLIKKELIKKKSLYFQELRTTNDLLFVFSAMFLASSISITKNSLVFHRISSSSLSVTRQKSWTNFIQALIAVKDFLFRERVYCRLERDFLNYVMTFTVWQFCSLPFSSMPGVKLRYLPLIENFFGITDKQSSFFYDQNKFAIFLIITGKKREPRLIIKTLLKNFKYF